jgi:hypothetical protein
MKFFLALLGVSHAFAQQCCQGIGVGIEPGQIPFPPIPCQNTQIFTVKNASDCPFCYTFHCPAKYCVDPVVSKCTKHSYTTCQSFAPTVWEFENCKLLQYASSFRNVPHFFGMTLLLALLLLLNS